MDLMPARLRRLERAARVLGTEYAPENYSLLFGEVLGLSSNDVASTAVLALVCVAVLACIYRPLMLSSTLPEVAEARGISALRIDLLFLALVALATTIEVPVVGALLMFSIMIGPPAAARTLTKHPAPAMALAVILALATVWIAIAASFQTNWPIGFFVGVGSATWYILARTGA